MKKVRVTTYDDTGIQAALDSLPKEGGVVVLPAGEYAIRNTITVSDNQIIRGCDDGEVLINTDFP